MRLSRDYFLYILLRLLSGIFTFMPLRCALFIARFFGRLGYYLDSRHKRVAYKNLRIAFASSREPGELRKILKRCFINLCQSFAEILRVSRIDKEYLNRFVKIEGRNYLDESFKRGKGVILLASHFGSWELAMSVCAVLGYPFSVIARTQKSTLLDTLLNNYRRSKGYKIISAEKGVKEIVGNLKAGRVLGLVADHGGGREGRMVDFFSRPASTPMGAVRLALQFNSSLIMVHTMRYRNQYHRIVLSPPLELVADIDENLRRINRYIESYVRQFPEQYLWFYKRWKYSNRRDVLILSDGKAGHLRQSEAVLKVAENSNWQVGSRIVEVRYKNRFARFLLPCLTVFSGFGRLARPFILRMCLQRQSYKELIHCYADMVVSCGSSLAAANLLISRENDAKSIVIMRPGIFSIRRFSLVIAPRHDRVNPRFKNIIITEGALNTIDESVMEKAKSQLISELGLSLQGKYLGILLGGDTKDYRLNADSVLRIIRAAKSISERRGWEILLTTSRRTPGEIEDLLKEELADYSRCRLMIIVSERNIAGAVAGILGLSSIVITSPESISMISESASSGKRVFVFDSERIRNKRHRRFLDNLRSGGYISLISSSEIEFALDTSQEDRIKPLRDSERIRERVLGLLE